MKIKKSLRQCANGHRYLKSSDCPVCPVCEKQRQPGAGFLSVLSAPARRALENHRIKSLQTLSSFPEKEIAELHGIGPAALLQLKQLLQEAGLSFKK